MRTIIKEEEITVPQGVFVAVASVLLEHKLDYSITEADDSEGEETVTMTISYEKEDRNAFRDIQDLISDYEDEDDDDE